MTQQTLSIFEGIATGLLTSAAFALGYLTPLGGVVVALLVVLLVMDVFFDSAGNGFSSALAAGLGKVAKAAWSPVDKATSHPLRLWAWRAPGLATLAGFLLAWGQSYAAGGA